MSHELTSFASAINHHHEAAQRHAESAIGHAISCGLALIQAKAALPHGQWTAWLAGHTTVSERQAQRYMRIARHRDRLNPSRVSDLSLRAALDYLKEPTPRQLAVSVRDMAQRLAEDYDGLTPHQAAIRYDALHNQVRRLHEATERLVIVTDLPTLRELADLDIEADIAAIRLKAARRTGELVRRIQDEDRAA